MAEIPYNQPLLEEIRITFIEPCLADAAKIRFKAEFSTDIGPVLPYLNATLRNATYNHRAPSLTFTREFRLLTLYPRHLAVAKALNTTDAWKLVDWLKNLINDTWARRDEITPCFELRSRPTALQIYLWLPRDNCKQCGEATCLAFATRLLLGERRIEECTLLFTPQHAKLRKAMLELVSALGYDPPSSGG